MSTDEIKTLAAVLSTQIQTKLDELQELESVDSLNEQLHKCHEKIEVLEAEIVDHRDAKDGFRDDLAEFVHLAEQMAKCSSADHFTRYLFEQALEDMKDALRKERAPDEDAALLKEWMKLGAKPAKKTRRRKSNATQQH